MWERPNKFALEELEITDVVYSADTLQHEAGLPTQHRQQSSCFAEKLNDGCHRCCQEHWAYCNRPSPCKRIPRHQRTPANRSTLVSAGFRPIPFPTRATCRPKLPDRLPPQKACP